MFTKKPQDIKKSTLKIQDIKKDSATRLKHLKTILGKTVIHMLQTIFISFRIKRHKTKKNQCLFFSYLSCSILFFKQTKISINFNRNITQNMLIVKKPNRFSKQITGEL